MWAYVLLFFIALPAFGTDAEINHESNFIYELLLEPLIHLDENLQNNNFFQITHCSIVSDETPLQYKALGSCLYEQIPLFSEEQQKSIVVHTLIRGKRRFDLQLTWQSISLSQLFSSYTNESSEELVNRIQITSADSHSLSEFFKYLLLGGDEQEKPSINQTTILALAQNKLQSWILQEDIDQWILDINPSSEDLLNVDFSVINSSGSIIYHIEFLTNYYIGSTDYFIQSKTGKKFALSSNQSPMNKAADSE